MIIASLKAFVSRYERHLSVASMTLGFLADNLLLGRADELPGTLLLYFYLTSSGTLILLIHLIEEGKWKRQWSTFSRPWLPIALQFIFGSTFSAFLVFYSRSASLAASWPFLLVLFAIFVGTEVFKEYQDRLAFQSALYFFSIFSFSAYSLPLFTGSVGVKEFLLSGALSIFVFGMFFALLFFLGPRRIKPALGRILASAAGVFILLNIFYFSHLLPPLPLALKNIGVYHSLAKTPDGYVVTGEQESFIRNIFGNHLIHIQKGDTVYVFSSVFTPITIQTNLTHRWEHWNDSTKKWEETSLIPFPISGGRDQGYRGFSAIPNIPDGVWRVSVETSDGALIGRIEFSVMYVSAEPILQNKAL